MNDDQLKRDIEEALSVEPSAQFAAAVRARIAESPRPSSVWIRWGIPAAGFAMATALVAAVLVEPKETVIPNPAEIVRSVPEMKPQVPPMPARQRPVRVPRAIQPSPSPQTAAKQEVLPEVLIDPREVAAFRRFIEGVKEERIDLAKLIELQKAAAVPEPIQEIALMPIEDLEPIVIESLTFGARRIEGGSL